MLRKTGSTAKMMKNNSAEMINSHFNETVQYDNYDPIQSVAMDNLAADANLYETTDDIDDRDTDSETDAIGENFDSVEIYGNAKGTVYV